MKKKVTTLEKSCNSKKAAAATTAIKLETTTTFKREIVEPTTSVEDDVCMETSEPYFTLQHGVEIIKGEGDDELQNKKAEVPGWRLKPITASYIMEGTENIEDENLLKRHHKPENDEKRRKRWDVQRIREQRHVARLRARYDPNDDQTSSTLVNNPNLTLKLMPEASKESMDIKTLLPNPEEASDILVQETLPVSVFGCVLPKMSPKDFSLPWMN